MIHRTTTNRAVARSLALCLSWLPACADEAAPRPAEAPLVSIGAHTLRLEPKLIALRRDLHQHPELSGGEGRTAGRISQELSAFGLEVRSGVGGHGVVGVLRGARPGPVVAYRADLDAMPGDEPAGREYGSQVPGVFHVCGHDVHSAVGVGVAGVLSAMRERLRGTAVFVFQPAEETLEGARAMLQAGALAGLEPAAIYALHSFPFPVGTVARDVDFGGLDQFDVELASPQAGEAVERVVERLSALGTAARPGPADVRPYLDQLLAADGPLKDAVYIDVETETRDDGSLHVEGSLRATSDERYPSLRAEIEGIVEAELGAGSYQIEFRASPFPSMKSDRVVSDGAAAALAEVVGEGNVLRLNAMHIFSGEDYALFLKQTPGAMFLLGVANAERGILGAPHFPDFDVDESAIAVGTKAMSYVLWQRLSEP